jgi:hypothetical protein
MRSKWWILLGMICGVASRGTLVDSVCAYELETHRLITWQAFDSSATINDQLFVSLGIPGTVGSKTFPGSAGATLPARFLMGDGSVFEDDLPRPVNHFFNPWTGQGAIGFPAPDWALEETQTIPFQDYSYRDAREALYSALTASVQGDRDVAFGKVFETLGHTLHLVEDMAQPQHVRSDLHPFFIPWLVSRYESWTEQHLDLLLTAPSGQPYPNYPNAYSANERRSLNSPRAFFNTAGTDGVAEGKGIAEFTARNFVSAGTNFTGAPTALVPAPGTPLPDGQNSSIESVDAHNETQLEGKLPVGSMMDMISTPITDTLFPEQAQGALARNNRTTTFSIFDQDLQNSGKAATFALNELNFRAAQAILIPRAIAYGAGLLDFFFRGDIDVAPDPAHTAKYVIRNFSPEAMTGTFAFYYDAQDGTRKLLPGSTFSNMTIPAKDAASNTLGLSPPFVLVPPLDAKTSGTYMLVFRGNMGEEKRGDGTTTNGYGAVVGRTVTAVPLEALYIAGMDASGQIISLRVDETGTHLLNGPDATGVLTQSGQFDPVRGLVAANVLNKRAYWWKQAHYLDGAATQYRIEAVMTPGSGFVRDPSTQAPSSLSAYWIAQSSDPAIGWFAFSASASGPNNGALAYTRTYTDSSGKIQTSSGSVPLPALPNYDSNTLSVGYDAFAFNTQLVVSEDGLTIHGFKTSSRAYSPPLPWNSLTPYPQTLTTTVYGISLHIALAQSPVVTTQVDEALTSVQTATNQSSDQKSYQPVCRPPIYSPPDVPYPMERSEIIIVDTSSSFVPSGQYPGTETRWVGLFSGALSSFTIDRSASSAEHTETHDEHTISGYTGWGTAGTCDDTDSWIYTYNDNSDNKVTTIYHLRDGDTQSTQHSDGTIDNHYDPSPNVRTEHCVNGDLGTVCNTTASSNSTLVTSNTAQNDDHIQDVQFVLRADSAGIVMAVGPLANRRLMFRGIDITGKDFVGDVSPLGEIFFATTDMTTVVHEPANGRMPPFAPPGNMVKIVAALWL